MSITERKRRVNGEMLANMIGQNVCLLGSVSEAQPNGKSFKLKTCDNKIVTVSRNTPNEEYVGDLVEVHGKVMSSTTVISSNTISFPSDFTKTFNMANYNEAVILTEKHEI